MSIRHSQIDTYSSNRLSSQSQSKLMEVFQYSLNEPILFISFSQRKYMGFRNRFEYDRKRVLIASKSSFAIIAYDLNDKPHELISMMLDEEEEIQMITFIDDENPSNILLVTYDFNEGCTISRVLNIRQENLNQFQQFKHNLEEKYALLNMVEDGIDQGKVEIPRHNMDNYCFSLDQNDDTSIFRNNESLIPYLPSHNHTMSSLLKKETLETDKDVTRENNEIYGMYASNGIQNNPQSTMVGPPTSFSFKDDHIYKVFDLNEQKIYDTFFKVSYFNKDIKRKILITSNINHETKSFFIKNKMHQQSRTSTPHKMNRENSKNQDSNQQNSQTDPNYLSQTFGPNEILQQVFSTDHKNNRSLQDLDNGLLKIVNSIEFHDDKYLLVYKKLPYLDVSLIYSGLIQRFNIEDVLYDHNLSLVQLKHIKIPVLNWSNRLLNKPDMTQKVVKILIVGTLQLQDSSQEKRQFLMLFNLEKQIIEQIKQLPLQPKVNCLNYGPYDNGYILLGMNDGTLLSVDFLTFEIYDKKKVFENSAITKIDYEPTRYIFVGSENGQMMTLTFIYQKTHYMYVELGMKRYCTIKVPKNKVKDANLHKSDPQQTMCCV